MVHHVYILYSKKLNRFYTGESKNVDERLLFHENSESRKFTSKAKDWVLFHRFECKSKAQAIQIESHIKRMKSSTYIRNLKKYPEMTRKLFEKHKC